MAVGARKHSKEGSRLVGRSSQENKRSALHPIQSARTPASRDKIYKLQKNCEKSTLTASMEYLEAVGSV